LDYYTGIMNQPVVSSKLCALRYLPPEAFVVSLLLPSIDDPGLYAPHGSPAPCYDSISSFGSGGLPVELEVGK
jgi:hypothetical protein